MRLVDYTLAKRATLASVRMGRLSRLDVCDAHPDLVRAARNVGEAAHGPCPICRKDSLVHVTYAFGDELAHRSGRVWSSEAVADLRQSLDEFACYVVEVCPECGWNFLVQRSLLGRRYAG